MSHRPLEKDVSLLAYGMNRYSQFGEDGILQRIFEILPKPVNGEYWAVEFGAWDGMFSSNSFFFIEKHGWSCVFIEGDGGRFADLLKNHGGNPKVHCINKYIGLDGENALENILTAVPALPNDFDLLSVDVDSCDYYLWESVKQYRPRVVIIEFNSSIPADIEYIQPKDFNVHDGQSLLSTVKLGESKGYELICCTDTNAIFVDSRYFDLFEIVDNSPETLFRPFKYKYQTALWQGRDGTLHLVGCDHLLWHNVKINERKLQVLPRFLRFFPGKTHPLLQLFKKLYYRFPVIGKSISYILSGKC